MLNIKAYLWLLNPHKEENVILRVLLRHSSALVTSLRYMYIHVHTYIQVYSTCTCIQL